MNCSTGKTEPFRLRRFRLGLSVFCFFLPFMACSQEYTIKQIADSDVINRSPVISETGLVAWFGTIQQDDELQGNIYIHRNTVTEVLTKGDLTFGINPSVFGNSVIWEGLLVEEVEVPLAPRALGTNSPAGDQAGGQPVGTHRTFRQGWGVCRWDGDKIYPVSFTLEDAAAPASLAPAASGTNAVSEGDLSRNRGARKSAGVLNVASSAIWGDFVAWQKASPWPCGWDILWADSSLSPNQLTTNCYYDMGPQIHGTKIVWYAWDGNDFEIMMHDTRTGETTQITDNNYDDVSPVIWGDKIAWEAYPSVDADIFLWSDGEIKKISNNQEDDTRPRIWENYVVWQGLRGENYQIFMYDGQITRQITSSNYDNVDPDVRDGLICWVGYEGNWDAEIFIQRVDESTPVMLTDNDYEDHSPRTAGGRVVWEAKREGFPLIYLAEPR